MLATPSKMGSSERMGAEKWVYILLSPRMRRGNCFCRLSACTASMRFCWRLCSPVQRHLPPVLLHNPLDNAGADAELLTDLKNAVALGTELANELEIG